ncbi:MAG TPA: alpha/beta hydrolase [Pyrinomonadaceae bacterium]|jgi:pimeloyl-ACP methyl ester carboxylesterase|nr:alpha/beta hydrolase [Pyrinomonadaceae bacterium]
MPSIYLKPGNLISILLTILLFCSFAYSQNKTSGYADIGGAKLYFEMAGKGKTVVLIHGGLADSRLWDDQFAEFAKHYRVVRYDLRGFGKSDFPTKDFSHTGDLYSLLKYLGIAKTSLVGLSLGGAIAADFTVAHPEMVEKLVLTSSGLRGDKSPRNEQSIAVYKMAETEGRDKAVAMWADHPFFASGKNDREYARRTREMLTDNYKYWGPTPEPIPLVWDKYLTIDRLAEIKIPVLIVAGDKDAQQIVSIAETLRAGIKNAEKVIIPGVSHHLNMEKPREYNKLVLAFLKKPV